MEKAVLPKALCAKSSEAAAYVQKRQENPLYERWTKGQLVWLKQSGPVFRPAKVKKTVERGGAEPTTGVVMYKEGGRVIEVAVDEAMAATMLPMGKDNLNCVADFCQHKLRDVSEPALLHNIRLRFEMGYHFQTLCDNVLLFLNSAYETDVLTLSTLSDIGDDEMEDIPEPARKDIDPFACQESLSSVVSRSFSRLVESGGKASQSIVVNGCEGSGKRDVTRFVLLRAIQLAKPSNAKWWQKLLAGDLLLQEFGGENGYVRWTELQLFFGKAKKGGGWFGRSKAKAKGDKEQAPQLLGAVCNAFGLEHSRVTDDGEMFPIFASLTEHASLSASKYTYLSRSAPSAAEPRPWLEITSAMEALGLSKEDRADLEAMLLGVLETGNIQFAQVEEGEDEDEARARQAKLEKQLGDGAKPVLGVTLGELRDALKIKTLHVKHETFQKERSTKEKYAVRDGLARVLYSALFDWIIDTVNLQVSRIDDVVQSAMEQDANDDDAESVASSLPPRDHASSSVSGKASGLFSSSITLKRSKGKAGGGSALPKTLQRTTTKGTIGIIGVLENAALVRKESTLEDLYQNYRLERFHEFFLHDVVERNTRHLVERAKMKTAIVYPPSGNDEVLRLFMGSVHHTVGKLLQAAAQSAQATTGAASGLARPRGLVAQRYQPNKRLTSPSRPGAPSRTASPGSGLGVLQLIEEEINLPGGNDKGLARRVIKKAKNNASLTRATTSDFTIAHFGGPVSYSLEGLVDRSRSSLIPVQVLHLLRDRSSNSLVRRVVTFKRDPIGQSGVMAKRELASMLELDNKAMEAAASSTAALNDPAEGTNGERRGNSETAKRIFNEMNRAVTILGRTNVQYIVSLASNPAGDPTRRLDPNYLLDQIREVGLSDAVCRGLYGALRGEGTAADVFVKRFSPLDAEFVRKRRNAAKADKLCSKLAGVNLITGQWALSDDKRTVFINVRSHYSLETALRLVRDQAVLVFQKYSRRSLAYREFRRRMHHKIKKELRAAIEDSDRASIEHWIKEAIKWKLGNSLISVAQKRLEKMDQEMKIIDELEAACVSRNCPTLYRLLRKAEESGMTGKDYPTVAKAMGILKSIEVAQISKEDKAELERKFAAVAGELQRRSESLLGSEWETDTSSEYDEDEDLEDDESDREKNEASEADFDDYEYDN